MTPFKIFKGPSDRLSDAAKNGKAGYCYYTTDEHKFYILLEDGGTPIALNALEAELDGEGNNIVEQFDAVNNSIAELTNAVISKSSIQMIKWEEND